MGQVGFEPTNRGTIRSSLLSRNYVPKYAGAWFNKSVNYGIRAPFTTLLSRGRTLSAITTNPLQTL
jgi:hypothetical protein